MNLSRREFLKSSLAAAAGMGALGCWGLAAPMKTQHRHHRRKSRGTPSPLR